MIHKFLFILLSFTLTLSAITTDEIIKKVEDNLNGKTAFINFTMQVYTKKSRRSMSMESYSVGNKKSFIKITYPKKDRGITFLKVDNTMWQYVPRIEKIIKIPASMMLQSWMGSDFTNDDLVRESSINDDYAKKLLKEDTDSYKIELIPHEDSTVVWGKIIMNVSKEFFLPTVVEYFDEDAVLVRTISYEKVKKIDEKFYPTLWKVTPKTKEKKGHKTVIIVEKAKFDKEISDSYFTKRALKRYSR